MRKPPPPGTGRKTKRVEVEARVDRVLTLIVGGAGVEDIRQFVANNWALSPRQADLYAARARKILRERAVPLHEEAFNTALERYRSLYKTAVLDGDVRAAAIVQTRIDKLLGLEAPTKTEVSGRGGGPIQIERVLDDAELSARIRESLDAGTEGRAFPAPDLESAEGD
ncbi:MAG: hypothetical protein IT186_16075 [Acidobacteria bacterium]|nr:hypothetical protein [Acidobacteriota bacterium]